MSAGASNNIAAASKLLAAPRSSLGVAVYAIHTDAAGSPQVHAVNLGGSAAKDVVDAAMRHMRHIERLTHLAYGPVTLKPGGHCLFVAASEAATLVPTQAAVDLGDGDTFDPKATYATDVDLLAVRLTLADGTAATLYRVLRRFMKFGRSGLLVLLHSDGQYNEIEPANLLLFDLGHFDALVADGMAYFESKQTFEQAFGLLDALKKSCKQTFDKVTQGLRIKNVSELEKACTSEPAMMAKMASISRSLAEDSKYADAMTMKALLDFVDGHPQLDIETAGTGNKRELVFDKAPGKRFKIPNLLDDDFLKSELTERSYAAGSKTRA